MLDLTMCLRGMRKTWFRQAPWNVTQLSTAWQAAEARGRSYLSLFFFFFNRLKMNIKEGFGGISEDYVRGENNKCP